MASNLMDIEPGGESSQYESIKTVTEPHVKDKGQFKDTPGPTDAEVQQAEEKRARGKKTAENVRYGEAISEHGMGGETTTSGGVAGSQDSPDGTKADQEELDAKHSREVQGYGPGSGVGA